MASTTRLPRAFHCIKNGSLISAGVSDSKGGSPTTIIRFWQSGINVDFADYQFVQ